MVDEEAHGAQFVVGQPEWLDEGPRPQREGAVKGLGEVRRKARHPRWTQVPPGQMPADAVPPGHLSPSRVKVVAVGVCEQDLADIRP